MQQDWQPVTTLPLLAPGELHVWRILLPEPHTPPDSYLGLLTSEEISRAARLRVAHVRLQFVLARAALRVLLGNLLSLPPSQVSLQTGIHGKPAVAGQCVRFNLAHTGSIVLIAFSRHCDVGIDIESIDRKVEALEIARTSFSIEETRQLEALSDPVQLRQAFFRCWARKEAIIKADGRGLSLPLASFSVPVLEPALAAPVLVLPNLDVRANSKRSVFYLSDLQCGDNLAAAVAVASQEHRRRCFDFPLDFVPRR